MGDCCIKFENNLLTAFLIFKDKDCSKKKGKEDQGNNPVDIIIKDPSGNVLTEEDLFGKKPKILEKDIKKIYISKALGK